MPELRPYIWVTWVRVWMLCMRMPGISMMAEIHSYCSFLGEERVIHDGTDELDNAKSRVYFLNKILSDYYWVVPIY